VTHASYVLFRLPEPTSGKLQVVVVVDPHGQDGLEDEMEKRTAESILKSLSAYAYAFIALFSDKQKEGYFVA
jgi:hypothetical protein